MFDLLILHIAYINDSPRLTMWKLKQVLKDNMFKYNFFTLRYLLSRIYVIRHEILYQVRGL